MSSDDTVTTPRDAHRPTPGPSGTGRRHAAIIGTIEKWRSYAAWNKTAKQNWTAAAGPDRSDSDKSKR